MTREPPYLNLRCVSRWLPLAASLGVSKVARGEGGFLRAYAAARGDWRRLSPEWRRKRAGFIARHHAQMTKRREPLFAGRFPTRRHLALIVWAYSPVPSLLC